MLAPHWPGYPTSGTRAATVPYSAVQTLPSPLGWSTVIAKITVWEACKLLSMRTCW